MGGESAFPQLDFSTYPSQMFWILVTFTLMYVIMANIVLPPIAKVVEKRKHKRSSDLSKAEKWNKETEELKKEYEEALDKARNKASQEIFSTEEQIYDDAAKSQFEYHKEAERRIGETELKIKEAKEKALEKLNYVAEEVVREIAFKLANITLTPSEISNTIKELNSKDKEV